MRKLKSRMFSCLQVKLRLGTRYRLMCYVELCRVETGSIPQYVCFDCAGAG